MQCCQEDLKVINAVQYLKLYVTPFASRYMLNITTKSSHRQSAGSSIPPVGIIEKKNCINTDMSYIEKKALPACGAERGWKHFNGPFLLLEYYFHKQINDISVYDRSILNCKWYSRRLLLILPIEVFQKDHGLLIDDKQAHFTSSSSLEDEQLQLIQQLCNDFFCTLSMDCWLRPSFLDSWQDEDDYFKDIIAPSISALALHYDTTLSSEEIKIQRSYELKVMDKAKDFQVILSLISHA